MDRKVCATMVPASRRLPIEVWTEILGHLTDKQDLPDSWASCRCVSRLFKVAAEEAYVRQCLRNWRIHLLIGYKKHYERTIKVTTLLTFHRLSADGSRIYFQDPDVGLPSLGIDFIGGDLNLVVRCLKRGHLVLYVGSSRSCVGTMNPMLAAKEDELAGISLDVDRGARTVSCLWKPLLSTFLGNAHDGNPHVFYGMYGRTKPGRVVRGV